MISIPKNGNQTKFRREHFRFKSGDNIRHKNPFIYQSKQDSQAQIKQLKPPKLRPRGPALEDRIFSETGFNGLVESHLA